jgi:hypothetical protein
VAEFQSIQASNSLFVVPGAPGAAATESHRSIFLYTSSSSSLAINWEAKRRKLCCKNEQNFSFGDIDESATRILILHFRIEQ